jgi:hypothetical protein
MGTLMTTYGDASLWAAFLGLCMAMRQRFGASPIQAEQGTSVSAAARNAHVHAVPTHLVARKADRFRPRGRRL